MQYEPNFYLSFLERTQEIVNTYDGEYNATLLMNCLLGLLVLPSEKYLEKLEDTSFEELCSKGMICEQAFPANNKNGAKLVEHPSFHHLIRKLRNSIAHFRIQPFGNNGTVRGFEFSDRDGFQCILTLGQIKEIANTMCLMMLKLPQD